MTTCAQPATRSSRDELPHELCPCRPDHGWIVHSVNVTLESPTELISVVAVVPAALRFLSESVEVAIRNESEVVLAYHVVGIEPQRECWGPARPSLHERVRKALKRGGVDDSNRLAVKTQK